MNVDANFTTYTKFTQSYSEANFILVSNSFLAALGLRCCIWAFSSCVERGYSSLWGTGSSLPWLLTLRSTGSRRAGFSSCAAQVWLLCGMWDLPGPGLGPVSPALAGRFSTTAPPGKPHVTILILAKFSSCRKVVCGQ